ncbi:uncharacterized protein C12orf50 homolog [Melopsittacus undulatus]|uniref:uncharacterized protein C12orf50 homolog n=1 Tax=Melopsittacus undulatus TaxID=13146 RepID=UPI00146F3518|nr:uncharacterized protein C12orf50 homolog [Melopsittacus undulatus]
MAMNGTECYFQFYSPYAQQKLKNTACFWERQPSGCMRTNCAFRHSKPRHINGLFLPPTTNAPLPQGDEEEILSPAQCQGALTGPENIVIPIHPPLIINLNDEEDDEEDNEEDDEEHYVSDWVPKTTQAIEEEKVIKEICYKSGDFYGIQRPEQQQSPNRVSPSQELRRLEAAQGDLQKGKYFSSPRTMSTTCEMTLTRRNCDTVCSSSKEESKAFASDSNIVPPELKNTSREGGSTGRRVAKGSISSTACRSFENGGSHTASPKVQPSSKTNGQCKDGETSSLPHKRETGRKSYFSSSEPRRSAYVVYRTVTVTQEPKFAEPRDKYTSGSYNAPTWGNRNPQAKTFSKTKTTIQRQEDMEVNRKGKLGEDGRERKRYLEFRRKI